MRIGVIACDMMRSEIAALVADDPDVVSVVYLDSALHIRPEVLRETVVGQVEALAGEVDAIFLGYGRCRSLPGIEEREDVLVFLPQYDDCISMLLSPERRAEEVGREAGTWFMTPGWARVSASMIISEMGLDQAAELGHDPMAMARRLFSNYRRGLLIDTGLPGAEFALCREQARAFCEDFGLTLEETEVDGQTRLREEYERFKRLVRGAAGG
jgi:hypothetical protein